MNDTLVFPLAFGDEFAVEVERVYLDRSFAIECVYHEDWRRRCAGIETLCKFWKIESSQLYSLCSTLVNDKDIRVRSLAIFLLSRCAEGIHAIQAKRLLHAIALEDLRSSRELDSAAHAAWILDHETRKCPNDIPVLFNETTVLIERVDEFIAKVNRS
jgi:hypothetical protein